MFGPFAFLAIQVGLSCAAALTVGRSVTRKLVTASILVAALALPLLWRDPFGRTGLTLIALVALIKCGFIAKAKAGWLTTPRRIWQVLVPFDISRTHKISPAVDAANLMRIGISATVATLALWVGMRSGQLPGRGALAATLACAAVFTYAFVELAAELLRGLHRLVGIEVGPLQRDPILSRSVTEFWGERWNLPISDWLNRFFFRPLVRKGHPVAGVVAAFLVSTAVHMWLFFAAVGWQEAASAGAFFLVQIPAVLLERKFAVRRWPAVASHLWTLGFLLVTSPLFVVPLIRGLVMQLAGR